jgi:hypothetical protein
VNVNKRIPISFQKLNKFEIKDDDTRFLPVKIWLMHLEENLNGSYFSKEVVENALPTLANTPILAYLEENSDGDLDFSDHRQVLVVKNDSFSTKYLGQAIGIIPESNNAQFEERVCDDGITRTFLTVEGLIWTKWDDPIDIMNRDLFKSESMELHDDYEGEFNEDDKLYHFTKFSFFGACALGLDVLPAMKNASIEINFNIDSFKNDVQEKMEQFKMAFSKSNDSENITIYDTKDFANVSGSWSSVNKTTLRNKLTKASNVESLVKEAYLVVDENWEDSPSESLHYPHHQIKGNKLIVHKAGVEAAFARLMQNDPNNSSAISHLKKHYEELGLDMSNFKLEGGREMGKEKEKFESDDMPNKDEMDKMMGDMEKDNEDDKNSKDAQLDKDMMSLENQDKQVKEDFSLTSEQLEDELSRILGQEKCKDDWGWEYSCFYYRDHIPDQNIVIAYSVEDCFIVGFNYSVNGDEVVIDMESKQRYKVEYVPMQVEMEKGEFSFVPTEIYEHYKNEVKENESIKSEFSKLEEEVTGLREFKSTKLSEERSNAENEIFDKFSSELTEDEMKPIKDKSTEYSLEDLEDKLFALAGRKKVKFSTAPVVKRIKMGVFEEQKESQSEKDVWAEQKEKFSSNK